MVRINPFNTLKEGLNEEYIKVILELNSEFYSLNKRIREIKFSIDYYHNFLDNISNGNEEEVIKSLHDLIDHNNEFFETASIIREERSGEEFVNRVRDYIEKFNNMGKALDLMNTLGCKYTIVKKAYRSRIPEKSDHLPSLYRVIGQRLTDLIVEGGDCEEVDPALDAINSLLIEINEHLPSHLIKPLEKLYAIPFCSYYKDKIILDKELAEAIEFDMQSHKANNCCLYPLKEEGY